MMLISMGAVLSGGAYAAHMFRQVERDLLFNDEAHRYAVLKIKLDEPLKSTNKTVQSSHPLITLNYTTHETMSPSLAKTFDNSKTAPIAFTHNFHQTKFHLQNVVLIST